MDSKIHKISNALESGVPLHNYQDFNGKVIERYFYLNQPIDYLDPRPEYIRIIIEWSTKSSIPMARIVSPDN
ncbi:unnamed protein product [Rotaria magnacalcarata]|uniref:Uncharacterized protein n=2 Tax=Rotaria magnacalcarata TaxID=392030 RepID=A0A820BFG0_9BILA|nr:unnamed protein product [Rotaria magnacalcarata]